VNVSIVNHDVTWRQKFSSEADRIRDALGRNLSAIHHIGSTSIPDLLAKPIIDILVEVTRIDRVDDREESMTATGYEACGEYGISGRRYFRKWNPDGQRTFHVHVFESGSKQVLEHIAFRDYLLAHPNIAREYSALKANLIANGVSSSAEYQKLKASFVEATVADAIEWSRHQPFSDEGSHAPDLD
jgi:GrpB-like predicted nucleotidyltransferase (UPF0157 family)